MLWETVTEFIICTYFTFTHDMLFVIRGQPETCMKKNCMNLCSRFKYSYLYLPKYSSFGLILHVIVGNVDYNSSDLFTFDSS